MKDAIVKELRSLGLLTLVVLGACAANFVLLFASFDGPVPPKPALTPGQFYEELQKCSGYAMGAEVTEFTEDGLPAAVACVPPQVQAQSFRGI